MLLSALFVLIPYIVTTSAELLFREQLIHDLGATTTAVSVISGLSVAGMRSAHPYPETLSIVFGRNRCFCSNALSS